MALHVVEESEGARKESNGDDRDLNRASPMRRTSMTTQIPMPPINGADWTLKDIGSHLLLWKFIKTLLITEHGERGYDKCSPERNLRSRQLP